MAKKKGRRGPGKGAQGTKRGHAGPRIGARPAAGRAHPLVLRMKAVEQVLDHGVSPAVVAKLFGPSEKTIREWVEAFRSGGLDALVPKVPVPPPRRKPGAEVTREAVVAVRGEHPDWGSRRISQVLARFSALGVGEAEVRRVLHEEGLIPETPPPHTPHEHAPRRFERASPNQLWQSDIFTFLLRRQDRLYLTAFMDDHSRFIVSHALAHHQRSELVMEALARGIARYGTPEEVLTDQGRQYTAWRGETDFERELRRNGIRHVKSRPQHPQTLGKIERFWKTLWDEFLSKTVFADFADCERRLALFIDGYNFQRPHQALAGLVPADRYFRAAPHVRQAVEQAVEENAMRLSLEQQPRKPFYLVGRLGDRDLSISAAGNRLRVQLGDDAPETIQLPREDDHDQAPQASRSRGTQDREDCDPHPRFAETLRELAIAGGGAGATTPGAAPAPRPADAFVAPGATGPRRDRAPQAAPGALGGERRDPGDGRDRGDRHLTPDVLPARGAGAEGHAQGAHAGQRGGPDHGVRPGGAAADRRARGEGEAARAGQAQDGPAALRDPQGGERGAAQDRAPGAAPESTSHASLGGRWSETFACLEAQGAREDDELGRPGAPAGGWDGRFDPDAGWRGRALRWDRKLTGADARSEGTAPESLEGSDDGISQEAREGHDVPAGADAAARPRAALRGDPGRADGRLDDLGRGPEPRYPAQPLPVPAPSHASGDDRGPVAAPAGAAAGHAEGAGADGGGPAATAAARGPETALAPDGGPARSGERALPGPGLTRTGSAEASPETEPTDEDLPWVTG